jgi:hypothetical protein
VSPADLDRARKAGAIDAKLYSVDKTPEELRQDAAACVPADPSEHTATQLAYFEGARAEFERLATERETGVITSPTYEQLCMTIPVREALERAGSRVLDTSGQGPGTWAVQLRGRVPRGIALVLIGQGQEQRQGLRLAVEPPYPGEWPEGKGVVWHERGAWLPCPVPGCARALVWYEAGYVPGYRICTAGHHVQLAEDGRSAKAVLR